MNARSGGDPLRLYHAYGLTLATHLHCPELLPAEGTPDVTVRRGRVFLRPDSHDEHGYGFCVRGESACHDLQPVGAFLVRDGEEIVVEPAAEVSDSVLRLSLLGPALGLLLHQRGAFVLHASVVALGDEAVAFVGLRGFGKSTVAALLWSRGHRVIADDIALLDLEAGGVNAIPGYPQLKLEPEILEALGENPLDHPQLHPRLTKRGFRFPTEFSPRPRPLRRIYVLWPGDTLEREPMPRQESFAHLMRHWYAARFGPPLLETLDRRRLFEQCALVAARCPLRRLRGPRGLAGDPARAGQLEELILEDLATGD